MPPEYTIRTPKDLNTLIKQKNGKTDEIRVIVQDAVAKNPISIFIVPAVVRYLTAEIQRCAAIEVMQGGEPNWLRYAQQMREFLPDEDIRVAALAVYAQSPWIFYNHTDQLKPIFPNEWFKNLIGQENLDLRKSLLWDMFLLYNGHGLPESFGPPIDSYIQDEVSGAPQKNVSLLGIKEPGFACGGMERNFLEAARSKKGITLVNGLFYAKYYHRKGDPAKVTYLPRETCMTNNGHVIWKDYFYSPSNGQHAITIEAIESSQKDITIPDLMVKGVRPTIGLKSSQIDKIMQAN